MQRRKRGILMSLAIDSLSQKEHRAESRAIWTRRVSSCNSPPTEMAAFPALLLHSPRFSSQPGRTYNKWALQKYQRDLQLHYCRPRQLPHDRELAKACTIRRTVC